MSVLGDMEVPVHSTSHRKSDSDRRKLGSKQMSSSSLEILPPADGETGRPWSASSANLNDVNKSRPTSRQSGAGSRVSRIDHSLNTRTPTPTKQVALTSVRRKTDGENTEGELDRLVGNNSPQKRLNGYYGDVHAMATKLNQPPSPREGPHAQGEGYTIEASSSRDGDNPQIVHTNKNKSDSALSVVGTKPPSHVSLPKQHASHTKDSVKDVKGETGAEAKAAVVESSDDDDDDDDTDTEESVEEKSAPMELLMEFLGCLMEKDYKNAEKLCKMVLLYEPDNKEALKFQPLIEEKLQQEKQDQDEGEDEDGADDEEGSSDDDDDDDDSDSDSEESSSEDESEEEAEDDHSKPDS